MHNLFIINRDYFYEAIINIFIEKDKKNKKTNKKNEKWNFNKIDLINYDAYYQNKLNLFASACYMISYNLLKKVINKKNKQNERESIVVSYCDKFSEIINYNLIMDNDIEELNEICEYDSMNFGIEYNEYNENLYDYFYENIDKKQKTIKERIDKKKTDMLNFVKELKNYNLPDYANEENQYRILSFPWCIAGNTLSILKFLKNKIN